MCRGVELCTRVGFKRSVGGKRCPCHVLPRRANSADITNVGELVQLAGLDDPSATINKPNQYDKHVKVSGKEQQQEQYSNEKSSKS
jgi:hypothetical protein